MARSDASAGQALAGRRVGPFTILELLGEGGSGLVYRARWGHREVALKIVRDSVAGRDRERFLDEARRLGEMSHPGVVKVLGSGELPDGRPYLAMELLAGEPLSARLGRGPLALEVALALFAQLASATEALHRSGLIHRDLKPENVFLVGDGRHAILLDFGIAKDLSAPASTVTQEGGVRGTPAYMAPERFFGEPASVASDVYELGVVLFAMLSAALPWDEAGDPAGRLAPRRLAERGVEVAAELETALSMALSTRPESRPASAAALAARVRGAVETEPPRQTRDLRPQRASDGPPVGAEPAGDVDAAGATNPAREPSPRPRHRARRLWLGAAIAVLTGAAVAAAVLVAGDRAAPEPASDDTATVATPAPAFVPRDGDDSGLATATRHLIADLDVVVTLRARVLRQSDAFRDLFTELAASSELAPLRMLVGLCGVDPFDDIDWVAVGVDLAPGSASGAEPDVDLVLAGAFSRAELESCIASLGTLEQHGALTELRLEDRSLWFGWLDDRTVVTSTRPEADRAFLEARLAGEGSLADADSALARRFAGVDAEATLAYASQSKAGLAELWPALPLPELSSGRLEVGADLDGEIALAYADPETATRAAEVLRGEVEEAAANAALQMYLSGVRVDVKGSDVVMRAHLDEAMTAMTARAALAALPEQ